MIFPERTVMHLRNDFLPSHAYHFSCLADLARWPFWAPVLSFLQPGPGSVAGVLWITHRQIKREFHRWFTRMIDFEKLTFKWASPHQLSHLLQQTNLNKTENDHRAAQKALLRQIWKASINWPSISNMRVITQWVFYFRFSPIIPKALWRRVHVITGPCKWKLCALIFHF